MMTHYETGLYVTKSWSRALRLARKQGTPIYRVDANGDRELVG